MFITLFFFNDTATTETYTLSLHDALPISGGPERRHRHAAAEFHLVHLPVAPGAKAQPFRERVDRSEEHTSELQSLTNLVCRLLLEKKKKSVYIDQYKK